MALTAAIAKAEGAEQEGGMLYRLLTWLDANPFSVTHWIDLRDFRVRPLFGAKKQV